jgi:large subunit ribosomal protein L32e
MVSTYMKKASKEQSLQEMLELRRSIAQKRPKFRRPESWRYRRIAENWRKPKGLDHKVRQSRKGWQKLPDIGMRGPRITRGLHPSGLREILISNLQGLNNCDPKTNVIRLAGNLGRRKRMAILVKAKEMELKVLNPRIKLPRKS